MPGGFTWADALYGFQVSGQLALDIGFWLVVASIVLGGAWSAMWVGRDRRITRRRSQLDSRDGIRAMAHERVARHEALPYTDEQPFTGQAGRPKNNHRTTRRRAS